MSRDLVTVEFGTPLQEEAWMLLHQRRIKALSVVDRTFRIADIVTLADFMRAANLDVYEGFDCKLRSLFGSTGHHHIPIIGEGERLVGMITQSDLVVALGRAADPAA